MNRIWICEISKQRTVHTKIIEDENENEAERESMHKVRCLMIELSKLMVNG